MEEEQVSERKKMRQKKKSLFSMQNRDVLGNFRQRNKELSEKAATARAAAAESLKRVLEKKLI